LHAIFLTGVVNGCGPLTEQKTPEDVFLLSHSGGVFSAVYTGKE
jgi:hypothetical protein